jgi:hypothetical protein
MDEPIKGVMKAVIEAITRAALLDTVSVMVIRLPFEEFKMSLLY